ncbi:MAG: hypothetical protein ABFD92_04120 [Planctomycetaceae bacterium]|nr:hypothetical protein [Planctomycetaceae bacterium]
MKRLSVLKKMAASGPFEETNAWHLIRLIPAQQGCPHTAAFMHNKLLYTPRPAMLPALQRALADKDPDLRAAALDVLIDAGKGLSPALADVEKMAALTGSPEELARIKKAIVSLKIQPHVRGFLAPKSPGREKFLAVPIEDPSSLDKRPQHYAGVFVAIVPDVEPAASGEAQVAAEEIWRALEGPLSKVDSVRLHNPDQVGLVFHERRFVGPPEDCPAEYDALVRVTVRQAASGRQWMLEALNLWTGQILCRRQLTSQPADSAAIESFVADFKRAKEKQLGYTEPGTEEIRILHPRNPSLPAGIEDKLHRRMLTLAELSDRLNLTTEMESRSGLEDMIFTAMRMPRTSGTSRFHPVAQVSSEIQASPAGPGEVTLNLTLRRYKRPDAITIRRSGSIDRVEDTLQAMWAEKRDDFNRLRDRPVKRRAADGTDLIAMVEAHRATTDPGLIDQAWKRLETKVPYSKKEDTARFDSVIRLERSGQLNAATAERMVRLIPAQSGCPMTAALLHNQLTLFMGRSSVGGAAAALKDDDPEVRAAALTILTYLGKSARSALPQLEALKRSTADADEQTRIAETIQAVKTRPPDIQGIVPKTPPAARTPPKAALPRPVPEPSGRLAVEPSLRPSEVPAPANNKFTFVLVPPEGKSDQTDAAEVDRFCTLLTGELSSSGEVSIVRFSSAAPVSRTTGARRNPRPIHYDAAIRMQVANADAGPVLQVELLDLASGRVEPVPEVSLKAPMNEAVRPLVQHCLQASQKFSRAAAKNGTTVRIVPVVSPLLPAGLARKGEEWAHDLRKTVAAPDVAMTLPIVAKSRHEKALFLRMGMCMDTQERFLPHAQAVVELRLKPPASGDPSQVVEIEMLLHRSAAGPAVATVSKLIRVADGADALRSLWKDLWTEPK